MIIPLVLFASSLALTVYGISLRLPLPPAPAAPARPPTALAPLERFLERNLHQAGLGGRVTGHALLNAMLLGAGLGGLLLLPTEQQALIIIAAVVCGFMPLHLVQWQGRRRRRATRAAAEAALAHIARAYGVRRHPSLAISDAVPKMASPMKEAFSLALSQCQAGFPLPDALRALAVRSGNDFYLSQFAEVVAFSLRSECDLSGALEHLVARMRADAARRLGPPAWRLAAGWLGQIAAGSAGVALLWSVITRPVGAVVCLAVAIGAGTYALVLRHPGYSPRRSMIRLLGATPDGGAGAGRSRRSAPAPSLWQALQARRHRAQATRAWPDLLAHLAIQTRAGADLAAAFASSLTIVREPLRGHLERLVADLRITPMPEALDAFARRCNIPGARALVQTIIEHRPHGAALPDALAAEESQTAGLARLAIRRQSLMSALTAAVVSLMVLVIGGFGLSELARAREVKAQALPALTAAVQSATRAPAEARRATFLQSLAANMPPAPPYEATLQSDPASVVGRLRVA
ncbi:MAG: hypothetical protein K0R39_3938, partial [Symbiobacteriaceae bacterium]|nr:hypothetical protein [Symbiobacteriaceae bacterium]